MIRKKNLNSKKEEEKERKEQELREQNRLEQERKQKQLELTENLKKTYSHIKPTIIQGQRILKVIFDMHRKVKTLKLFDGPILALDFPEAAGLSEQLRGLFSELKQNEEEFVNLKLLIEEKVQSLSAYQDDDASEDNTQEEELSEEQRKILEEKTELERRLEGNEGRIQRNVQKITLLLHNSPEELQILQAWQSGRQEKKLVKDVGHCVKALKFLFVKKLSTGFDEEQTHNALLKKLEQSILENTALLEVKEAELSRLKENRSADNQSKNTEITKLKEQLESLVRQQEQDVLSLITKSEESKKKKEQEHKRKKKNLEEIIRLKIEELKGLEKANLDQEMLLQKQNDDT